MEGISSLVPQGVMERSSPGRECSRGPTGLRRFQIGTGLKTVTAVPPAAPTVPPAMDMPMEESPSTAANPMHPGAAPWACAARITQMPATANNFAAKRLNEEIILVWENGPTHESLRGNHSIPGSFCFHGQEKLISPARCSRFWTSRWSPI